MDDGHNRLPVACPVSSCCSRSGETGIGPSLSRRQFLSGLAASSAVISVFGVDALAAQHTNSPCKIIGFTKPFQTASPAEIADIVAEVGWDGVECPVRPKGQIEPERVEEQLPRLVEALRKVGREVTLISTSIKKVSPLTEKVLRTASNLGIRRYRMAFWNYSADKPIPDQVAEIRAAMRDLAAINKELDLCGAHQNHSGAAYFGAPIWDIYESIKDYDPNHLGICFDIGHATIEGGLSWPIEAQLMRPFYTAVFVKDFVWKKSEKGWNVEWCPLGEGAVDPKFFGMLKQSGYNRPISQHHEYEVGTGAAMIAAMKKDLDVLKQWLAT